MRRLEQVWKSYYRRQHGRPPTASEYGFGNFGLILAGDFGQLPPVLAASLIADKAAQHSHGALRSLALQGQIRFRCISDVICLRRIYRQSAQDEFKESTIRLRDAICTPDDWKLWQTHELDNTQQLPAWPGSENLLDSALYLTIENAKCGRINGQKLKELATRESDDAALKVILRCQARHNDVRAENKPNDQFRQLRQTTHLALLAPVMLTQNYLYGVNVVALGLMNGARGACALTS